MNQRFLYLFIILFGMVMIGCETDFIEGVRVDGPVKETGSVITMVTQRTDGIIRLSIDAPAQDRFGMWIDLDGDGKRAEDRSEDVSVFNSYQEYTLAAGVREVSVYGDIAYLAAAANELTSLDVSHNYHLVTLNVPMNNLSAVNISQNRMLARLDVSDNDISALIVMDNMELVSLWCYNNRLTDLDVTANSALEFLDCSGNQLSSLDVSANTQLSSLLVYNNRLSTLNISQNQFLNRLWAFGNHLLDTEAESLVSTLRSVSSGDLWLTEEPLGQTLQASAIEKGWKVQ